MGRTFIDAVTLRRSYYHIGNKPTTTNREIIETVDTLLSTAPSPFNIQSARIVILFGDQHLDFWNIVIDTLRGIVDSAKFDATKRRIDRAFRGGYGTILFYEDEQSVDDMRKSLPLFADKMSSWSEQSSAMLQFMTWTALEDMGYGASLQHYNPIIDNAVRERWLIPPLWRLIAQMPFGTPLETPAPRIATTPTHQRRLIYGTEDTAEI